MTGHEFEQAGGNTCGAVPAVFHAMIKAAVTNGSAGNAGGSNAIAGRIVLDGGYDLLACHAAIRDCCPVNVKGLLRPHLGNTFFWGTCPF